MKGHVLILIVLMLIPAVFAHTLQLITPSGQSIMLGECSGSTACVAAISDIEQACFEEGQYRLLFTADAEAPAYQFTSLDAHYVDFNFKEFCNSDCLLGREVVYGDGYCCGAKPGSTCGKVSGNKICVEKDFESWMFGDLTENKGDILHNACSGADIISTGSEFRICGIKDNMVSNLQSFSTLQVTRTDEALSFPTHEFICAEPNPRGNPEDFKMAQECAGADSAMSRTGGYVREEGHKVELGLIDYLASKVGQQYSAKRNINPSVGIMDWTVEIGFDGDDGNRQIFFLYDGDSTDILLEKTNTGSFVCSITIDGHLHTANFDAKNWKEDEIHKIKLEWSRPDGFMRCTLDGTTKQSGLIQGTNSGSNNAPGMLYFGGGRNLQPAADITYVVKTYETIAPVTYYCSKQAKWVKDLDATDAETCNNAELVPGVNLQWTGSKCCSEDEDWPFESYNEDPSLDPPGACFNSVYFENGPVEDHENLLVARGNFYGCNITADSTIGKQKDTYTNKLLVNQSNDCQLIHNVTIKNKKEYHYYCDMDGKWKKTDDPGFTAEKAAKSEFNANLTGCCRQDKCWNGVECVDNQVNESEDVTYNDYRCINGNWEKADIKKTFDRKSTGFCAFDTCLVTPEGNSELNGQPELYFATSNKKQRPACINNGQYINQFFCEDGHWTTRTKELALNMIGGKDSYSLFCGAPEDVANYMAYDVGDISVAELLTECEIRNKTVPCVNNLCVLKSNGQISFGMSLNTDVSKILPVFEVESDACEGKGQSGFQNCRSDVYYDAQLNSLIKSPQQITKGAFDDQVTQLKEFISASKQLKPGSSAFNETGLFDEFYLVKDSLYNYFSFMEKDVYTAEFGEIDYIGVLYEPFRTPGMVTCDQIKMSFDSDRPRGCENSDGKLKFIQFSSSDYKDVRERWRDISSKLRQ